MALFRCSKCKAVYEDYYPVDDTCCKCNSGTIRIIQEDVMSVNRLLYWCEECQAFTYDYDHGYCCICSTGRVEN